MTYQPGPFNESPHPYTPQATPAEPYAQNPYGPTSQAPYSSGPSIPNAAGRQPGAAYGAQPAGMYGAQGPFPNPWMVPAKKYVVSPILFFVTAGLLVLSLLTPWTWATFGGGTTARAGNYNGIQLMLEALRTGNTEAFGTFAGIFLAEVILAVVLVVVGIMALSKGRSTGKLIATWFCVALGLFLTIGMFAVIFATAGPDNRMFLRPGLYMNAIAFIPAFIGAIGLSARKF